jgi:hypothetical protein
MSMQQSVFVLYTVRHIMTACTNTQLSQHAVIYVCAYMCICVCVDVVNAVRVAIRAEEESSSNTRAVVMTLIQPDFTATGMLLVKLL